MTDAFFELPGDHEFAEPAQLTLRRAQRLAVAVQRNNDCALLALKRRTLVDGAVLEMIEFDIDTHGVPSRNPAGIRFRERVGLIVPANERQMIGVAMLRKTFPMLMHQNATLPDQPRELCLYFEPARAILRTWTPEAFLRRIQWWLALSARGQLHAADQPAEQLFFVSRYELVLPWDFDRLRENAKQLFALVSNDKRKDGSRTVFLNPLLPNSPASTAALIDLVLPTVIHGRLESEPFTLGELADRLQGRGVDLLKPLKNALQARVGTAGQTESQGGNLALILLHIPIARAENASVETVQRRAYVIEGSLNKLGMQCGALVQLDKRFYDASGILGEQLSDVWRERVLLQVEVSQANSAEAARRQSGINDEGPHAVLVGAGSLGSALLALWGRSGWGKWTVIDKDHIKPHNLSRHTGLHHHIGVSKVQAVEEMHSAVMFGATSITSIVGDAADHADDAVTTALRAGGLVVDASAALDYPRYASCESAFARHISVFLTPSGRGAVLLAEDEARGLRLRTIEAQYYRALLRTAWGTKHLLGHHGSFWSGASCRDISFVMPYSCIVAHAGNLAEQVRRAWKSPRAVIRIWERDETTGATDAHEVEVKSEQSYPLHGLTVYIDDGIVEHLRNLRTEALPNETGGIVLGYHDFNIGALVVVDALAAPADSKSSPAAFERGVAGLKEAVTDVSQRTANIVGYIGEWHSHPNGVSANPSRDDLIQLVYLALGMSQDGLPAIQLIVADDDIEVLQGAVC